MTAQETVNGTQVAIAPSSMNVQELIAQLSTIDPASDATQAVRALLAPAKPKPRAKASQAGRYAPRDTSAMTDDEVRKYFKGRDLYDSAIFHRYHDLAARIEQDGPTPAHKAEYWRRVLAGPVIYRNAEPAMAPHPQDRVMCWRAGDDGQMRAQSFTRAQLAAQPHAERWHAYSENAVQP